MKFNKSLTSYPKFCKYIYLFSILVIHHSLSAVHVYNLGDIVFSDPLSSNQQSHIALEEVIDDIIVTQKFISAGFDPYPNTDQPNYLQLRIAGVPTNNGLNLNANERVDYFIFTSSIYYSWDEEHATKAFNLSYSTDDAVSFTKVTDYISAETENAQTTISYNSDGDITATLAPVGSPLEVHRVAYRIEVSLSESITHLRYNVPVSPGWNTQNGGNICISEFDTSMSAQIVEVIPEPSTYALLAGILTFAIIAYKKQTQA